MNIKVAIRSLEAINIEEMEAYLEDMAEEGWLLREVRGQLILIFERLEPLSLDFRISPFAVEDEYSLRTDEELREFEEVCQDLGWTYVLKQGNLYIFYKERGSQALEIHTDEEEEAGLIRKIVRDKTRNLWLLLFSYYLMGLTYIKGLTQDLDVLTSAVRQLLMVMTSLLILVNLVDIFHFGRFKSLNREGDGQEEIKYLTINGPLMRGLNLFKLASAALVLGYLVYLALAYKDGTLIGGILILLVILIMTSIYRRLIKPRRLSRALKNFYLVLGVVLVFASLVLGTIYYSLARVAEGDQLDPNRHRVLLEGDFYEGIQDRPGYFQEDHSILVPLSYRYISSSEGDQESKALETQYNRARNQDLAENLFRRYEANWRTGLRRNYREDAENILENGWASQQDLDRYGLKDGEVGSFPPGEEGVELLLDRLEAAEIQVGDREAWQVDQVVYLNQERDQLILRNGLEVYKLGGLDFSDRKIIARTREILGLD